jgi:hypothetical protein
MTPLRYVLTHVYPLAFSLLPPQMNSGPALVMLTAIALQESRFLHRRQIASRAGGILAFGPARGWWQFEMGGVEGVLSHHASRASAEAVCRVLGYDPADERGVHLALEHNDVLAACFARLLLWTDPRLLPQGPDKAVDGWTQYLATWRPGKPHATTWAGHFATAWSADLPGTVRA